MSGFKLIAIRPLVGCDKSIVKNLVENEVYILYKEYKFIRGKGSDINEVKRIKFEPVTPQNLYNIKSSNGNLVNVNISAIVGKNGSGKSTLSELLLYAIFFIANELNYIKKEDFIELDNDPDSITESISYDGDVSKIKKSLNVELFYSLDDSIYKLKISDRKMVLFESVSNKRLFTFKKEFTPIRHKKDLSPFFYSIVTNYSLYAYNTYQIGYWIKAFFHKNDGYQTPVVISPYRERGNIDVNKETYLTSSRLLANILSIRNYTINPKSAIKIINLFGDKNKNYKELKNGNIRFTRSFIEAFRKKIISPLYEVTFNFELKYPSIDSPIMEYAEIYLINKLITN